MNWITGRLGDFIRPYAVAIIAVCVAISAGMLISLHNKRVHRAVANEAHKWELMLASIQAQHEKALADATVRIVTDDSKTLVTVAEQQDRIRSLEDELEAARKVVPLSGCDACRIPASRVIRSAR